jgi:hypothetical protein
MTPSTPNRRRHIWPIVAAALATFFVVLTLLAYQVRSGRDPALGRSVATAVVNGRHVLVSRTSGAAAAPAQQGAHAPTAAPLSSHTSGAVGEDD